MDWRDAEELAARRAKQRKGSSMTKPSREDVLKVAKECGIVYYLTPENTKEMHGTDSNIERFAAAMYAEGKAQGLAYHGKK